MKALEKKLGYSFRRGGLLETALTHSSFANESRDSLMSNERLEFLGDSVLGFLVAERLYASYPDMPEGRMTRLRAELVCEQSLLRVARELRLGAQLRLGRGEEQSGGRERASILADCVEAVLAAIYLDGGIDAARRFVSHRVLATLESASPPQSSDYKTELQELVQRQSGRVLSYSLLGESGPDHQKLFTAQVALNGEPVGTGTGTTKKEAEQAAARAALLSFETESRQRKL